MKQEAPQTEKEFGRDMQTFEQLPARTKELNLLQHRAEKATGQESVTLNAAIREKAKQVASNLPVMNQANSTLEKKP